MSYYEIVVMGHLGYEWESWLGNMKIKHLSTGETEIHGELKDQTAVYGIISKLRDMNLKLISIQKKEKPITQIGI